MSSDTLQALEVDLSRAETSVRTLKARVETLEESSIATPSTRYCFVLGLLAAQEVTRDLQAPLIYKTLELLQGTPMSRDSAFLLEDTMDAALSVIEGHGTIRELDDWLAEFLEAVTPSCR